MFSGDRWGFQEQVSPNNKKPLLYLGTFNGVPFYFMIPCGNSAQALQETAVCTNIPMWYGSFYASGNYIGSIPASNRAIQNSNIGHFLF